MSSPCHAAESLLFLLCRRHLDASWPVLLLLLLLLLLLFLFAERTEAAAARTSIGVLHSGHQPWFAPSNHSSMHCRVEHTSGRHRSFDG